MFRKAIISTGLIFSLSGIVLAQGCHGHSSGTANSHKMDAQSMATSAKIAQPQAQTKCPIMGNSIDKSVYAVWNGDQNHTPKKVYFCCPGCIDTFNADPIKYIKKLEIMKQPIENVIIEQKKE